MGKIWNVAIYVRVSTDKKEQQESIAGQVQSLNNWLIDKSKSDTDSIYNLIEVYEDSGFSGATFERESFMRMKQDIEKKKVNMVITRDLSRFSRNYILAGFYLEDYFKVNAVRFVSVLDNVDTLEEVDDIVPFKNILNEMYIKDCSRRSRDGLRQRMLRGSSIASKPPYGYKFETVYEGSGKTIKLIPAGDETTDIVKEIFELYIRGWGFCRIASHLNSTGVKPPSARLSNFPISKSGIWTNNSIKSILINPKYAGIMVQGRWKKVSYKVKKVKAAPESQWIYGGKFEGIISKEVFDEVQKTMKNRAKTLRYKGDKPHLFSGALKCGGCSGSMCYRKSYEGYKCTNSQTVAGRCTAHSIKEEALRQIIVNDLMKYIELIDKDKLYEKIKKLSGSKDSSRVKKLEKTNSELEKLDWQFERLYMDKLNESIDERNYENILKSIQLKQQELQSLKLQLQQIQKEENQHNTFDRYIKTAERIMGLKDLDRETIDTLIDKIIIAEDSNTGKKTIDIFYKFVV